MLLCQNKSLLTGMTQPPEPPIGVVDLHSQPGILSDSRLVALGETLSDDTTTDIPDQLTQYISDDEAPGKMVDDYRQKALEYVTACIEYRGIIRPDSLRELDGLPDEIDRTTVGAWVYYSTGYDVEHDRPKSDADTTEHGKYLFFSPEAARELEDIVIEQFQQRPYTAAKLPTKPAKREDWVLCLYQSDNRYWYDLREEYNNPPAVRFRGYKTDAATRRGEYSDRFKKSA